MPIAFAISFFLFVGLAETLRHGVFGLSNSEVATTIQGALVFCALFVLRTDILYVLRRPTHALYGDYRLNWTWGRSALGLVLGLLLALLPIGYGIAMKQITYQPVAVPVLADALLYQGLAVAVAAELFFREAAVKAFQGHFPAMIAASVLACFVYHIPAGLPQAMIAAASGLYFLSLRLLGCNILVVVLIHATLSVLMTEVVQLGFAGAEMWRYAIYFTVATAALSFTLLSLNGRNQKEIQYA